MCSNSIKISQKQRMFIRNLWIDLYRYNDLDTNKILQYTQSECPQPHKIYHAFSIFFFLFRNPLLCGHGRI